jgi:tetratricopeptide (TPR) repeat protein
MRLSSRLGRQAISTVRILLAGTLLVVTVVPPADAQRGLGKGRQRPPEQVPAAEPAPGEYALEGSQAIEAVNRGEGRQALAYYERTAAEAEKDGNQVRAARAWHAAAVVANRLGRYQKGIQSASRAIELFKKISARRAMSGRGARRTVTSAGRIARWGTSRRRARFSKRGSNWPGPA